MQRITPIPIGVEFYKEMIEKEYYYVDKTLLIRDILDTKSKITLFTRPRHFGKTLAQTTLRTFFEKEILYDGTVLDNSEYFTEKKIMYAGEEYTKHMGQYPVIFLSLKSAKQLTYDMAYGSIIYEIIKEYNRHQYILSSDIVTENMKEEYMSVLRNRADKITYAKSIAFLSECLEKYHEKKAIILIDEYDVPLENAYFNGFYEQMVSFMRSLFESSLKTNESLNFAVTTGCLRISRESIFTGLNNFDVVSVLDESYAEYFGFVQKEVDAMLEHYKISQEIHTVKKWYDGYLFGNTEVYNPWSIINYVKDTAYKNTDYPKPYWANTSSNSIVKDLVEKAENDVKREIERLIDGETIEKKIHEDITYIDIYTSKDNLWNFLFFTGYLKKAGKRWDEDEECLYLSLTIPNKEISYIYRNTVLNWFEHKLQKQDLSGLIRAFEDGDCDKASVIITEQLIDTISFYDYKEAYYHGFLAGLLKQGDKYLVNSNRESGLGRYDLVLKTYMIRQGRAIILELKVVDNICDMEKGCLMALGQIESMHYDSDILKEGYTDIVKYGLCFYKKECLVMRSTTN